jgi:chromosome segregation ATPase
METNYGKAAKHVMQLEAAFKGLFEVAELVKKVGDLDQAVKEKTALDIEAFNKLKETEAEVDKAEAAKAKAYEYESRVREEAEAVKKEAAEVRAKASAYYGDVKEQARQVLADAEAKAQREFDAKADALDKELDEARKERDALAEEIAVQFKSIADLKAEFEALKAKFS